MVHLGEMIVEMLRGADVISIISNSTQGYPHSSTKMKLDSIEIQIDKRNMSTFIFYEFARKWRGGGVVMSNALKNAFETSSKPFLSCLRFSPLDITYDCIQWSWRLTEEFCHSEESVKFQIRITNLTRGTVHYVTMREMFGDFWFVFTISDNKLHDWLIWCAKRNSVHNVQHKFWQEAYIFALFMNSTSVRVEAWNMEMCSYIGMVNAQSSYNYHIFILHLDHSTTATKGRRSLQCPLFLHWLNFSRWTFSLCLRLLHAPPLRLSAQFASNGSTHPTSTTSWYCVTVDISSTRVVSASGSLNPTSVVAHAPTADNNCLSGIRF